MSTVDAKREKRREKRQKIDKLTNWYMINLTWGVLGFIALGGVENMFSSADTVLVAPVIFKTLGVVFALLGVLLFALTKAGKIKNGARANNYAIFSGVLSLVSLLIGFYSSVRNAVIAVIPALSSLRSEWWYVWSYRYLIVIYLVLGFIFVTVKTAIYSKSK